MKKVYQVPLIGAAVAVLGLVTVGGVVNAVPNAHAQAATDHQTTVAERKAAIQTRLTDARLKVCRNREKTITNIMARLADRGTKQLGVFNTIADRTEAFYTSKGKTLATYDTLTTNVASTKAAAETAVSDIQSSSTSFSCDASDPKGIVASFKNSLQSEIAALKNYKTAIKNLVVGVKSVQSTTSSDTTTDTTTTTNEGATE